MKEVKKSFNRGINFYVDFVFLILFDPTLKFLDRSNMLRVLSLFWTGPLLYYHNKTNPSWKEVELHQFYVHHSFPL